MVTDSSMVRAGGVIDKWDTVPLSPMDKLIVNTPTEAKSRDMVIEFPIFLYEGTDI